MNEVQGVPPPHFERRADRPARPSSGALLPPACLEALAHLRSAVAAGEPWPRALLYAMGLWTLAEEVWRGRRLRYLILDEAFDWLLLAQRLAEDVEGLIPPADRSGRLATGRFLEEFSQEDLRRLLGTSKYRAYLNYWYGVTVEGSLQVAAGEEIRKEHVSRGRSVRSRVTEEAFRRVYGEGRSRLEERFRAEHVGDGELDVRGSDAALFTYWLFRRRLRDGEPSRVASDTRKGLERLYRDRGERPPVANGVSAPVGLGGRAGGRW